MNKKGMEMTLGTVITAIILLVVLGVILYMFAKGMGQGDNAIKSYFKKIGDATEKDNKPINDPSQILGDGWNNPAPPKPEYLLPLLSLSTLRRKKRI